MFATGGLGGVHRAARDTWDESADLVTLARTPITVVCAGVKSILDVAATLERLETLNVTVLGYGTDAFPGFYLTDSGLPGDWRVDRPSEVAAVMRARTGSARAGASWSPTRCRRPSSSTRNCTHACSPTASPAAERAGVAGKDATPFLLDFFHGATGGASLEVNVRIVLRNAALAAQIAAAA